MITKLTVFFISLGLALAARTTGVQSIMAVCQTDSLDSFQLSFRRDMLIDFDVYEAWKSSQVYLDEDGYIREVCFPFDLIYSLRHPHVPYNEAGPVVVRRAQASEVNPYEVQVLKELASRGVGFPFYGCVYNVNSGDVFLVYAKASHSLATDKGVDAFKALPPKQRWANYAGLIQQVLNNAAIGFLKHDIRHGTIAFSDHGDRQLMLTGYRNTQPLGTELLCTEQTAFNSPRKCRIAKSVAKVEDDLYSLFFTMAVLESSDKGGHLLAKKENGKWFVVPTCNAPVMTSDCYRLICKNAVEYFKATLKVEPHFESQKSSKTNLLGLIKSVMCEEVDKMNIEKMDKVVTSFLADLDKLFPKSESVSLNESLPVPENTCLQSTDVGFNDSDAFHGGIANLPMDNMRLFGKGSGHLI